MKSPNFVMDGFYALHLFYLFFYHIYGVLMQYLTASTLLCNADMKPVILDLLTGMVSKRLVSQSCYKFLLWLRLIIYFLSHCKLVTVENVLFPFN